jgi:hypothetical protein
VPEHFYSEVLGVLRWQLLGEKLTESHASAAVRRLGGWHLRHASVAPLVQAAWSYRHNLTAADALYVALAEQLGASFLTDDHRLVQAPTFPSHVPVLRLRPVSDGRPQAGGNAAARVSASHATFSASSHPARLTSLAM